MAGTLTGTGAAAAVIGDPSRRRHGGVCKQSARGWPEHDGTCSANLKPSRRPRQLQPAMRPGLFNWQIADPDALGSAVDVQICHTEQTHGRGCVWMVSFTLELLQSVP